MNEKIISILRKIDNGDDIDIATNEALLDEIFKMQMIKKIISLDNECVGYKLTHIGQLQIN